MWVNGETSRTPWSSCSTGPNHPGNRTAAGSAQLPVASGIRVRPGHTGLQATRRHPGADAGRRADRRPRPVGVPARRDPCGALRRRADLRPARPPPAGGAGADRRRRAGGAGRAAHAGRDERRHPRAWLAAESSERLGARAPELAADLLSRAVERADAEAALRESQTALSSANLTLAQTARFHGAAAQWLHILSRPVQATAEADSARRDGIASGDAQASAYGLQAAAGAKRWAGRFAEALDLAGQAVAFLTSRVELAALVARRPG